jgi:2-amino-4-hydroxy-6-hydroxymethyldihydropteridine diphosphokinase
VAASIYAIGIGSNRRGRHGAPAAQRVNRGTIAASPIVASAPLGPSSRRFANAAVLIESDEPPPALLARLKAIEAGFGRRNGRRWGARVIDLDILLWSGGAWGSPTLVLPHRDYRCRRFVLAPLAAIAPDWRDPLTGRTTRQLLHAIDRPRPRP